MRFKFYNGIWDKSILPLFFELSVIKPIAKPAKHHQCVENYKLMAYNCILQGVREDTELQTWLQDNSRWFHFLWV